MSDDARKAAEDWAAEFKQWLDAGNAYGSLSEAAMIGLRDQFARAIMKERAKFEDLRQACIREIERAVEAERERCAQIALRRPDSFSDGLANDNGFREGWSAASQAVAAAIRSGKP